MKTIRSCKQARSGRTLLAVLLSGFASLTLANDFIYPQGVYDGEAVTHGKYDNGGVVNAAVQEQLNHTQPIKPRIMKIADGVWALVGYHWGYNALIEGDKGLILYDTGDDIEEGERIVELAREVSDKPITTVIYSHAHYTHGTRAVAEAYGQELVVIGHPELNRNILESGGLGAAIPELSPSLLARTMEQFSYLLPESGPDAKAPTPEGKAKGFVPVNMPVSNGQEMTVDGVDMVFYTDYDSDTTDQVIVYLPRSKTVLNNHLWPGFPNFYTLRGSEYRDPTVWAGGIRLIRDLKPEHLINT